MNNACNIEIARRPATAPRPGFLSGAGALAVRTLDLLVGWQERAQQRYMLASLDDRNLRDMGISRADVAQETSKPFWRL